MRWRACLGRLDRRTSDGERDDLAGAGHGPGTQKHSKRGGDHVDVELVDQPDQPNMGPPHTAPAPRVPRTRE